MGGVPGTIGHRLCIRDRIRTEIVRRILDGRYQPDMRLKEMALAHEFGTSQAPVREALRELEVLGLVENERYRGTRVLSMRALDLRDAYELRAVIEERAAQMAVPCQADDLAALSALVDEMMRAAQNRDSEGYISAALVFHRRIVELSGNRQFLTAFDAMQWGVRTRIAVWHADTELCAHAADHVGVLDSLLRGDGIEAGVQLRTMLEGFIDEIEQSSSITSQSK